jgi:ribosome biogenesis GTPase
MLTGTVVEFSGDYCYVALPSSEVVLARKRGRVEREQRKKIRIAIEQREWEKVIAGQEAVGDKVRLGLAGAGQYVIEEVLERETWLLRRSGSSMGRYWRRPQCVVANADQLSVVVAPNPVIRPNVIDRYFLGAIQGGLKPLLVVNKIDLDTSLPSNIELNNYRDLGYPVFFTQANAGIGLDALGPILAGKFTTFCGHSGVGKSTILSALTGLDIAVAEVHAKSLKGRQTTAAAKVYNLPGEGQVVDTPGVREFGLIHLSWLDVHEYFTDIAEYAGQCAFRDCTHTHEPDCVVQQAIAEGRLGKARLDSYVKLRQEAESYKHWE